jgi:hypothetical protein
MNLPDMIDRVVDKQRFITMDNYMDFACII